MSEITEVEELVEINVESNVETIVKEHSTVNEPSVNEKDSDIKEKEDVINKAIVDIAKITFQQTVETYLSQNNEELAKVNIKLSPEIKKYLLFLCKENPLLFNNIEDVLKKIILDDKIDTKDIPEVIVLVNRIYDLINNNKPDSNVDPYELIKSLIHSLFVIYIQTNNVQNVELANNILKIIEASIDLIKLKEIKPSKNCCLYKLFTF